MANTPPDGDSVLAAAARASAAGMAGRNAAVVLEGTRFPVPAGPGGLTLSGMSDLDLTGFPGRERDCLLLRMDGSDIDRARLGIRILKRLGVSRLLILSDAEPVADRGSGSRMVTVRDHVNLRPANPLVGPNDGAFGPRFPDMSHTYDADLRARLQRIVDPDGEGVVVASSDRVAAIALEPERSVWSRLGIGAVTSGLVPASTVARHAGMTVCAVLAFDRAEAEVTAAAISVLIESA